MAFSNRLISAESRPAGRSELSLFDVPQTEIGIQHSQYIEVNPKNTLTNSGPFVFQISPNPQLLQLNKNYLLLEFRILGKNGQPISEKIADPTDPSTQITAPITGPINYIGATFIRQLTVHLNGHLAFDSGPNYAFLAYLQKELCFGWDAKHSHMEMAGYEEESGMIDDPSNAGFTARAKPWRKGGYAQVLAPLQGELFHQDRFLLPNIEVLVTIHRNPDNFCLLNYEAAAGESYTLDISSMKLYCKSVDVLNSVSLSLEKALLQSTAKYPIKRVAVHTIHISESRRKIPENDIFGGEIPSKIICGMVSTAAYYGNLKNSPFNFQHFKLNEIYIVAGGQRYPNIPLSPDFENNRFVRTYYHFLDSLGYTGTDGGNSIDMKKYAEGWTLFSFNLTPSDENSTGSWNLGRRGTTTLQMEFAEAVPTGGIVVIIYAEYDSLLTIDSYRNCFYDYKV